MRGWLLVLFSGCLLAQSPTPVFTALAGHGAPGSLLPCDIGRTLYTDLDGRAAYLCIGPFPNQWYLLQTSSGQGTGELQMAPGNLTTFPTAPLLSLFFDSNSVLSYADSTGHVTPVGGGGSSISAGPGLLLQGGVMRANPAAIRTFLTGSASLTFGSIAPAGGCASKTIPVTGAVIGDRLYLGTPTELLTYSLALTYAVSAADTVTIRLCNYTAAAITPPVLTWNVDVVKSF